MVALQDSTFASRGCLVAPARLWENMPACQMVRGLSKNMPRIHNDLLDAVFYLYPSAAAARSGEPAGGTGTFVAVPVPDVSGQMIYACSNKHVVGASGCSVVRINRIDGGVEIFDSDPAQWAFDPHNDLAATPISFEPSLHRMKCLPLDMFITREEIREHDIIGPGQEVFMVGRFINHDGAFVNAPSVRFGHLSMMPLSIRHPAGYDQESFAVEMLSRPGYSGSPVYVYSTSVDLRGGPVILGNTFLKFLGLNWGFISDPAEIREKTIIANITANQQSQKIQYVAVNTGMNGVVPAWRLREFLETGELKKHRDQIVAMEVAKRKALSSTVSLSSAPQANDANPKHQEDFTRLVSLAAQKPAPKG